MSYSAPHAAQFAHSASATAPTSEKPRDRNIPPQLRHIVSHAAAWVNSAPGFALQPPFSRIPIDRLLRPVGERLGGREGKVALDRGGGAGPASRERLAQLVEAEILWPAAQRAHPLR